MNKTRSVFSAASASRYQLAALCFSPSVRNQSANFFNVGLSSTMTVSIKGFAPCKNNCPPLLGAVIAATAQSLGTWRTDSKNISRWSMRLVLLFSFESFKRTVQFGPFYHFLAVSVQSAIDNPLRHLHLVIVLKAVVSKPFSNRIQTRTFRLVPQRVIPIGPVDYSAKQGQRWIRFQLAFFENGFKRTFLAMVA